MMRLSIFAFLIVPHFAVGLVGCGPKHPPDPSYRTAAEAPRRNTERARKLNTEGLDALDGDKIDEAETKLKAALDADVTFGPAHNNLGKVYFQQKKYYLAAWEFQHASKLMPDHPEPRNNLGLVLEQVGKLDDAIAQYEKAREIRPDNAQFIGNLARARLRRGDDDEEVRGLLHDLVYKDTRTEWVSWARETLARMPAAQVPDGQ